MVKVIPDVPEEINIQMKRTTFITSKLIDQISDDNAGNKEYSDDPIEFSTYPLVGGYFRKKSWFVLYFYWNDFCKIKYCKLNNKRKVIKKIKWNLNLLNILLNYNYIVVQFNNTW